MAGVSAWSERDSTLFLDRGRFYVPARARQIEVVTALVPRLPATREVIDLCCGEGLLAEAILVAHPEARVLALDGSPTMREEAARRLARFGDRVAVAPCELFALALPPGPRRAIVSSLALHHLEHADKPALYRRLCAALAPGGALVIADLVLPAAAPARELAAEGWDGAVRDADNAAGASGEVWRRFQVDRWNWFRYPDDVDHPAPLALELDWLRGAGFTGVDVPWADRGHAVYAGFRPAS